MSFSNVNCEEENEFDEKKSLSKDYFNERLERNDKIQIHSEITCERVDISTQSNQIAVATLINEMQIPNLQIDDKEDDVNDKSPKGKNFSPSRKPLRNVLMERRLRSRKKSKILKNQTRRQIPPRRKAVRSIRTKVKKKKKEVGRKMSKERLSEERREEFPKIGKRGLVGGKAKAQPPIEDFSDSHESDEDPDSFHFYRISLGYFQKYRNVQGASTSTRRERSSERILPSFKPRRLEAKNSEERELLELQEWGMASLITDEDVIGETNNCTVYTNPSENFERNDETYLKASRDFSTTNRLYQNLNNINERLADVEDIEFRSDIVKPKIRPKSESAYMNDVNYKWIQTPNSISVEIKCPVYVINSNQVSVKPTPFSLEINIKFPDESEWTPFFNCNLAGRICPERTTWCLGRFPSILIYLRKYTNELWESFTQQSAEPPVVDKSRTDLKEIYHPAVLNLIKNFSLIEVNKSCTKGPTNGNKNKSKTISCTTDLRDVVESGEEFKTFEKFE